MKPRAWSFTALTNFETCPRKYYETSVSKKWPDEMGEAALWGNQVHEALDKYIKGEAPMPESMLRFKPLADKVLNTDGKVISEQKIALNNGHQITEFFAPDVWVRVIFDVTIVYDDRIVLLDWKTGKRKPNSDQLRLFAAAVLDVYPHIDRVTTGFVWLKERAIDKEKFVRGQPLWEEFLPRVARFNKAFQTEHFPEKPSGLCRAWCPVLDCEFNGRRP